jgi:hypothetical protein
VAIVTPDAQGMTFVAISLVVIFQFVIPLVVVPPALKYTTGVVAILLLAPLYSWQVMVVSADRLTLLRTLFVVPIWFRRIAPDARAYAFEGDDREEPGITFDYGNKDIVVGNGWNAEELLATYRRCRDQLRAARQRVVAGGDA